MLEWNALQVQGMLTTTAISAAQQCHLVRNASLLWKYQIITLPHNNVIVNGCGISYLFVSFFVVLVFK